MKRLTKILASLCMSVSLLVIPVQAFAASGSAINLADEILSKSTNTQEIIVSEKEMVDDLLRSGTITKTDLNAQLARLSMQSEASLKQEGYNDTQIGLIKSYDLKMDAYNHIFKQGSRASSESAKLTFRYGLAGSNNKKTVKIAYDMKWSSCPVFTFTDSFGVNVTASSGGTDIESDDSLTERTYLVPSTYSCAGPPDAYEYFAKAWRNDVKDVSVQSPSPCVVDIYFTLQDGTLPSKSDCDSMEENLRNDARRPMTDYVNCKAPTEVEYSIDVTYTIARSKSKIAVTVQNAVNEAVEVYKAWQRTMGRDIDPAELIAQIKNAGAKKVKITAPTDVVVGSAEIPKLTTCNVVYGGLEDD